MAALSARDVSFDRKSYSREAEEELVDARSDEELVGDSPVTAALGQRRVSLPRVGVAAAATLFMAVLLLPHGFRARVGHDTVKLLEGRPSEMIGLSAAHCQKEVFANGDMWCCSSGDTENFTLITGPMGSISCSPVCFPGEAIASVEDARGLVPVGQLAVGDRVLARSPAGGLHYEPVLGWLHRLAGGSGRSYGYVAIEHTNGTFRASETHLVFVASAGAARSKAAGSVAVGDQLLVASVPGAAPVMRDVLAVRRGPRTQQGMVAPLTASGTIVVDGALASVYASPSARLQLPHSAAHAAFFPVRALYGLGLRDVFSNVDSSAASGEYAHPFTVLLERRLRLDRLLVKA